MDYVELIKIIRQKRTKEKFSDDDILLSLKEVEQEILNYCVIPEVPEALKYVWCNITIDLLLYNHESNTSPEEVLDAFDASDVSTIQLGDTKIQLGDKYRSNQRSRILQSHQANLDNLIMNYREQLNRFRRIW